MKLIDYHHLYLISAMSNFFCKGTWLKRRHVQMLINPLSRKIQLILQALNIQIFWNLNIPNCFGCVSKSQRSKFFILTLMFLFPLHIMINLGNIHSVILPQTLFWFAKSGFTITTKVRLYFCLLSLVQSHSSLRWGSAWAHIPKQQLVIKPNQKFEKVWCS